MQIAYSKIILVLSWPAFMLVAKRSAPQPKKIVYLFGAGATHAELINFDPKVMEKQESLGLLISNVSARVVDRARRNARYLSDVELVSGTSGSLNIELLISLIENSKVHGWEFKSRYLKSLVQRDIEKILTKKRTRGFNLHKALLEFHRRSIVKEQEIVSGFISLNYDDILDKAYKEFYGEPNYAFSLEPDPTLSQKIPLLKLHGSFNWVQKRIRGRIRTIEIIPLGSQKSYLHAPYSFIWNRALEILVECETLRIVGCSLSQNDAHLIDLLFKAQLERSRGLNIEIINSDSAGDAIRKSYGFFSGINTLTQIEGNLISDKTPVNPFKTWLIYKSRRMLKGTEKRTRYLKAVHT